MKSQVTVNKFTKGKKVPNKIHYTNMYSKYKWDINAIASNILAHKFSPLYQFSSEKTPTHNIMCNICYNYFPTINQTNCCFHHICTECIAATIDPKELICPFCRKPNLTVTPNQKKENLKTDDLDDEEYSKYQEKVKNDFDFDDAKGCSDEAIAIAMQYKLDAKTVNELLLAGLSQEEIISNLNKNSQLNQETSNLQTTTVQNRQATQQINLPQPQTIQNPQPPQPIQNYQQPQNIQNTPTGNPNADIIS